MFYKKFTFFLLLYILAFHAKAQHCDINIRGYVFDEASQAPLPYVNIYIQETKSGTTTDDDGKFSLGKICPGHYHFIISHIGCEDEKFHFDIEKDTVLNIALSHTPTSLGTVVIASQKKDFDNQANSIVKRSVIEDNSNQNISGILENETGVHLIKNGNGISKPVVHGLYGNRLLILNNGIAQSGQQWGNDHSPEIDPFSSDKITIVKGASIIEYGGANLGSIILSEPKRIIKEPHLHGQVNYIHESNGWGHTINSRLEKYSKEIGWRINGTLKKYGDKKTADYFLNNTGLEEMNLSLQLEKNVNAQLLIDFYASTFNTKLGVLRGSHIGNLTDLEQALVNEVPFFTEPNFSYQIDAPKQQVSHHLAKARVKYFLEDNKFIELVLAGQINNRKEFDIRRGDRSDIPALSLFQSSAHLDLKYSSELENNWKLKFGNQTVVIDNTNNPETGILPLIPDYLSIKSGLFATASKTKNNLSFNTGIRYDYENQLALAISNSIPREVIRYKNNFSTLSGLMALKYNFGETQSVGWNIGYAMRAPAINELYSNGLHQGVSGIEEGKIDLEMEKAIKNTLEYRWVPSPNFALNLLAYHQHFQDYIYLNPQDEFRLTIRGAFPVYKYEQTDANIYGIDMSTQFTIGHSVFGLLKYSFLLGDDLNNNQPLIFMPPNSLFASLTYRTDRSIGFIRNLSLDNSEIEITNRLVFKQKHILDSQDFAPTPDAYNLIGLKFASFINTSNSKIKVFIKADNLLNVSYRDYLNRQRYFADDLGFSLTSGINFKF